MHVQDAKGYPQDIHDVDSQEDVKRGSEASEEGIIHPTLEKLNFDPDNKFYIPNLTFSKEEEKEVIRILDTRMFTWLLLTTFFLNMDRTNHSNAVSDNLPEDLGFNLNTVNTGVALNAVFFSITCLSGSVMAKIVGPSRCM